MDKLEYDRRYIWHPYASLKNPPPVRYVKRAYGTRIETDHGTLTDGTSSWWCVAHGYSRPEIVEAIRRQSEAVSHVMFGGLTHGPAIELAERLAAITPKGLTKVFFADSGSISVEVAVKMCLQYQHAKGRTRRTKMLTVKGGYHGDTACAMALSDPDGMHVLFAGMMPKHFFAGRPASVDAMTPTAEGGGALSGWDFEAVLEAHKEEIAGVIVEPIFQAANAMNFYDGAYLREMRRLCDAHDMVLVFDEIAAGFYRTGPRWAHEVSGIAPDIMTVGKALTGGHLTLAATIASEHVAEVISNGTPSAFMHGPTYMANPLACAAGIASLKLFEAGGYEAKARHIEAVFRRELGGGGGVRGAPALPGGVRGAVVHGAVAVIKVDRLPAQADIERVLDEHQVWLRPFANFIYAMPPLVSSDDDIRRLAGALKALAACPPGPEAAGDFHE